MRKSASRPSQSKSKPNPMAKLIRINQNYAQLLQKLAPHQQTDASAQAQLFSTLQHLRELNSTMKQELTLCETFTSAALDQLLSKRQLDNVGNLIGRYEQLNDEIDHANGTLQQQGNEHTMQEQLDDIQLMEQQLQEKAKQLTARRIALQNRKGVIAHQLQCGNGELRELKTHNLVEETRLRELQRTRS